jgi:hypothetical protein
MKCQGKYYHTFFYFPTCILVGDTTEAQLPANRSSIWQNPSENSLQKAVQAQLRLDDAQAGNVEPSRDVSAAVWAKE